MVPDLVLTYYAENLSRLEQSDPSPVHIDTHSMATIQHGLVPPKTGL